ncbi:MAG: glycoside hydrolase family 3 C-terminal domain-containing protein [Clostridia bacterium]|nr:glycoside hydrolase family 3 C-terminal domain-containing protein [Clostridia bacterium]
MTREQAEKRAREIVNEMTVEEKASVLRHESPDIPRLGIYDHNWWNEASHGVARNGMATVFPHAIALAATFNPELIGEIGETVSTEARAKYNENYKYKDFDIFKNLTYWTPNINIFRDPRWGRGQETYGEDPYLTATLGVNYIKGIQGDGEYLKAAACAKHLAVHSGPEATRHGFDVDVSDHDLHETYLPAFEWAVKEAGVVGVMGAYNRFRGQPCCANDVLMKDILFGRWGFDGYFVSDCGAIRDIWEHHHCADSLASAAALTLNYGCHLNCGDAYYHLMEAYEADLITEEQLTEAAVKVMSIRVQLGEFEEERPYTDIPFSKVECEEHRELNLEASRQCMVLLKNDGILPLNPEVKQKIAVIGPNAMSEVALEGNYNGMSGEYITVAEGMRQVFGRDSVRVAKGSNIWVRRWNDCLGFSNMVTEGKIFASEADVTVLVLGLDCHIEGEENDMVSEFFNKGDKRILQLPKTQMELAEEVCSVCDNVIVVTLAGSAVDLGETLTSHAKAIIHGWYPGALGGLAVAELLAGKYSPSGKLPLTFYKSVEDLPPFEDYSMAGRTYRYFKGEPQYPFGFGLSYTKFSYADAKIISENEREYEVSVTVSNIGERDGMEKVQIYGEYTDSRTPTPIYQLCGTKSVNLGAGESAEVTLKVNKYWLSAVLSDGERVTPDGLLKLHIGSHQPDEKSEKLSGTKCVTVEIK